MTEKLRTRQQIFDALSVHQKDPPPKTYKALVKALANETDRGAIVIVCSLTEDLLLQRVMKKLPKGEAHKHEEAS